MTKNAWGSNKPVEVAYGGLGAATLTDGALLLGNGTSAVEQLGPPTKGELVVGVGGGASPNLLTVGTNGYILTADSGQSEGVAWGANSGSAGPSAGDLTKLLMYSDCTGATANDVFYATNLSVGGADDKDHPGVYTANVAASRSLATYFSMISVTGGPINAETVIAPTGSLITGGSDYYEFGMSASLFYGVYFRYNPGSGDSNWIAVTENFGTSETDTGVAPALDTWVNLRIEINTGATQVLFKIDGSTVATHTTKIPPSSARMQGYVSMYTGTAAKTMDIDALMFDKTFTGDRA